MAGSPDDPGRRGAAGRLGPGGQCRGAEPGPLGVHRSRGSGGPQSRLGRQAQWGLAAARRGARGLRGDRDRGLAGSPCEDPTRTLPVPRPGRSPGGVLRPLRPHGRADPGADLPLSPV